MDCKSKTSYFTNKEEFIDSILPSITPNKFITMKHDPNYSHGKNSTGKSVFSLNMSGSISPFLIAGNYEITEYENIKYPNNPYVVIVPKANLVTGYNIPKGISYDKYDNDNYEQNDCIVIVSGSSLGWHGHTEKISNIMNRVKQGNLKFINILK